MAEVPMNGAWKRGFLASALLLLAAGLCSAQIPFLAPANSAAKVTRLTGQVSVMKDSYPWALQVGATIQPQQLILTGADGYAEFQVSDGSTFEVFPNSKVIFRNNSASLKDLVDMIIGRIRVHIEKIGGQPNPNSVTTPTAVISVRGTTFDVVVDDADESTLVAVTEGLVEVQHKLKPSGKSRFVGANEVLRVYKDQPLAQRGIDKGIVADRVFRGLSDAIVTIMRSPRGGTGVPGGAGGGAGPTLPGDSRGSEPPPPPPPPPPPGN